jgi:hypothetical protein
MYCSSCGTNVTPGLSYCNRCGAELSAKERGGAKLSDSSLDSLVWAIAAVTIVGLGTTIGLMAVMKEVLHFNDTLILIFSVLSFLTFMGVDAVFIWVLLRSRMGNKTVASINQSRELTTKEIGEAKARSLAEPAMSVTEHTTRTLDPAERQLKSE